MQRLLLNIKSNPSLSYSLSLALKHFAYVYLLGRGYSVTDNFGVTEEGHRRNGNPETIHVLYQIELVTENSIQPRQRDLNEEIVHRGVNMVNG